MQELEWLETQIDTPPRWTCVQQDCDGIHHYYVWDKA